MDKNTFDKFDKEFQDAIKKVRDCVNSEAFKSGAAIMAMRLTNAAKNGKGRVSMDYDAPRMVIEVSGNEAALIMAMQQLIQHFGVEKALSLVVANYFLSPESVDIFNKTFESNEEREVFKRVMNMSEEEREKIKNDL